MANKTIKAWVNGAVQDISVPDVAYTAPEQSIEDRISALENKGSSIISTVTLLADSWTGPASPYSQTVTINGVTAKSKVDLQPTASQTKELQDEDIAFMAENNNGTVTVYAINTKPTIDYTFQVQLTEVEPV